MCPRHYHHWWSKVDQPVDQGIKKVGLLKRKRRFAINRENLLRMSKAALDNLLSNKSPDLEHIETLVDEIAYNLKEPPYGSLKKVYYK
jgi:hypothetical protein